MTGSSRKDNLRNMTNRKLKDAYYSAVGRMIELKKNKNDMDSKAYKNRKKNISKQIREIKTVLHEKNIRY